MGDEAEKGRYVCRICGEDLTEQVDDQLPIPVFHILASPVKPKSQRIQATCSKGHMNIFTVNV
jgi:hypothetical protein